MQISLSDYQQLRLDVAVQYGAALVRHGSNDYDDAARDAAKYAEALLYHLGIENPDYVPA